MNFKKTLDIIGIEVFPDSALERLEKEFEITRFSSTNEFKSRNSTHVWLELNVMVDEIFLAKFPFLSHIICRATSTTNLNIFELSSRGIQVISLRGHSDFLSKIPSTAELAWFLLQISCIPLVEIQSQINSGMWDRSTLLRSQLVGKNLGIIGLGRLGKIVAKYAEAFGMNIMYSELKEISPTPKFTRTTLANLCKSSDFIVLTASVYQNNVPILNSEVLKECNPNLKVINVSRGFLVDETILIEKLKNHEISYYAADTCKFEELRSTIEDQLNFEVMSKMSNVFLTPHIGGYSIEAISETTHHLIDFMSERSCECIMSKH